jgi:hypothetical protein
MVWGIEDGTHRVIGTSFEPLRARRGNDVLEFWLARRLDPSPALAFRTVFHPEGRVVLLEIPAAIHAPVKFSGIPLFESAMLPHHWRIIQSGSGCSGLSYSLQCGSAALPLSLSLAILF